MKMYKNFISHETTPKKTSIGRNSGRVSTKTMNKHKKRSYKPYKGQGK
tara:strand:+ start:178 stop:321 length:144 start_codon:yes stop_codon:yes gene_type:complete